MTSLAAAVKNAIAIGAELLHTSLHHQYFEAEIQVNCARNGGPLRSAYVYADDRAVKIASMGTGHFRITAPKGRQIRLRVAACSKITREIIMGCQPGRPTVLDVRLADATAVMFCRDVVMRC